jgi:hypothetical protein
MKVRQLKVTAGSQMGRVFLLDDRTIIGREGYADIQLLETGVSRQHACVFVGDDGRTMIMDMASTNGTRVDDRAVSQCELSNGAVIVVGESIIHYEEVDAEDAMLPSTGDYSRVMRGPALGATTQISGPARTKLMMQLAENRRAKEACTDPLHQQAAAQAWSFCPKCGEPPT